MHEYYVIIVITEHHVTRTSMRMLADEKMAASADFEANDAITFERSNFRENAFFKMFTISS